MFVMCASCCVALLRIASGAKIFSVAWRCSRVHVVVHDIFRAHFCTYRVHIQTGKKKVHFLNQKLWNLLKDRPDLFHWSSRWLGIWLPNRHWQIVALKLASFSPIAVDCPTLPPTIQISNIYRYMSADLEKLLDTPPLPYIHTVACYFIIVWCSCS